MDFPLPDKLQSRWISILETFGLQIFMKEPTMVTETSKTDHIYVTNKDTVIKSHLIEKNGLKDHCLICISRTEKIKEESRKHFHGNIGILQILMKMHFK